jgi:hypothetical protein
MTASSPRSRRFGRWSLVISLSTGTTATAAQPDCHPSGRTVARHAPHPACFHNFVTSAAPTARAMTRFSSWFVSPLASAMSGAPPLLPAVSQARSPIDTSAPLGCGLAAPAAVSPK